MSETVKCPRCNRRRKPFGRTILNAVLCRFCTEKSIGARLGRVVLLTHAGKDTVSGKTFDELMAEMEKIGRPRRNIRPADPSRFRMQGQTAG